MAEYRGASGRVYRIDPPRSPEDIPTGTVIRLNDYTFVATEFGPMRWGVCVDCGGRALEVQPTGRIGAGGLEEDLGATCETRCEPCGRAHRSAGLDYYETGRDALYVRLHIDPAILDPQYDHRGRTSCEQFFAPGKVLAANVHAERTGVPGRWVLCARCRLPLDPAGRTVEHPDLHMACVPRYPADVPMETPLYPPPRQES